MTEFTFPIQRVIHVLNSKSESQQSIFLDVKKKLDNHFASNFDSFSEVAYKSSYMVKKLDQYAYDLDGKASDLHNGEQLRYLNKVKIWIDERLEGKLMDRGSNLMLKISSVWARECDIELRKTIVKCIGILIEMEKGDYAVTLVGNMMIPKGSLVVISLPGRLNCKAHIIGKSTYEATYSKHQLALISNLTIENIQFKI